MKQLGIEQLRNKFFHKDSLKCSNEIIKNDQIDLIITDPPFAINARSLDKHYHRDESHVIDGYVEWSADSYFAKTRCWVREAERILRPGGSIYVVSGYTHLREILNALDESSLKERNHLIWKFQFGVSATKKFVTSHYHVLYYTKPGGEVTWNQYCRYGQLDKTDTGASRQYQDLEDVWTINKEYKPGKKKNKNELPTQLLAKMIQYSSNPDDLILDFFLGGFSTAIVAKGLNRDSCGFEISEDAYQHGVEVFQETEAGCLLNPPLVPIGVNDKPLNQGKPISDVERSEILKAFADGKKFGARKKEVMEEVMGNYQRGYWSIEKILKEAGGWTNLNASIDTETIHGRG